LFLALSRLRFPALLLSPLSRHTLPNLNILLRCLIVDDEPSARQFLRKRLAAHPEIEVIGEAESNEEALAFFNTLLPDVIFLDINMPQSNGLELPALLPKHSRPAIVFVTAHEDHALRAFELDAIDYLLKPYSAQRMAATVDKLRRHFEGKIALTTEKMAPLELEVHALDAIVLREQKQLIQVEPHNISVIKALGDYTRLTLLTGKSYLLRQRLMSWEELLPQDNFFRVDRFRIINMAGLVKVERVSRNKMFVTMMGLNQPEELARLASIRLTQRLKQRTIL